MKIGLLLPSVYMGEKYKNRIFAPKELLLNLAQGLVEKGHTVFIYGAKKVKTTAYLITGEEDLISHDLSSRKFAGYGRITREQISHHQTKREYEIDLTTKAYKHAKENNIEIIHSYHDFFAHYLSQLVTIPTVYTLHDPPPPKGSFEYWRLKHFKDDNYIFISQSQKNHYKGLVKGLGVVYHGLDMKKFPFSKDGGNYLAFIGRYVRQKGVAEAIETAKKLGVRLILAGDDASRRHSYYKDKVLPNVYQHGNIREHNFFGVLARGNFLKNARALIFPILWEEPFGLVMVEAMACGTPVVAFAQGSVPEIIKDGKTGFIINSSDQDKRGDWIITKNGVKGLCEAVSKIYKMPDSEYKKMREACRAHVKEKFTLSKMVDSHEKIYRSIIC